MVCVCVRMCVHVCVCWGPIIIQETAAPGSCTARPPPQPVDWTHITAACVFLVGDTVFQLPSLLLLAVTLLLQLAQPDLEALW